MDITKHGFLKSSLSSAFLLVVICFLVFCDPAVALAISGFVLLTSVSLGLLFEKSQTCKKIVGIIYIIIGVILATPVLLCAFSAFAVISGVLCLAHGVYALAKGIDRYF